ncbi:hypothetical protein [Devosia chinhatensis]|uniref:Uncharacterized protein n=1 Tax=Devosia chinhatensis TaxID=429727 RepID=A0A0F5FJD3_9HYPH|nr:hypothetical protein [Devosia chinhatensis]KKB08660.1 hypothetical protein VE26_00775 [Devosia chinhatensis]
MSQMFKRLFSRFEKRRSGPNLPALQAEIVRRLANDVTDLHEGSWEGREWVYLALNHEVLIEEGRRSSSQAVVLAHLPGAELESLGFRLSRESKEALLALRDAMADDGAEPWTVLDLTVERSGHYEFSFGYGPPPRLNGDLLHSPLQGLLGRYHAART